MTSLIVFIVWLTVKLSQSKSKQQENTKAYWEKEMAANAVPKKSLDDLSYINFPFYLLPTEESFSAEGENIPSSLLMMLSLKGKKIVNLNNISNTDLKLSYGTTNITVLTEYDENFITLCREGYLFTEYLSDIGRKEEAIPIARALIDAGSDVSNQFTLLYKLYHEAGDGENCRQLTEKASSLESTRKDAIVKALSQLQEELAADNDSSGPEVVLSGSELVDDP
ncbi:MAG: hypothetical protein K5739_09920 [Lachnospiraceae bacterium]|nr:hypothetical protein [Lachnospiraceae bacterium]